MDEKVLQDKRKRTGLVLTNIYNLPAMSTAMMEVTKMLDNPSTNTQTLSKMIGKDQGIATKILSIANSPLYGLRRRVSTIDFAILVIGFLEIKNIILALSMMESFRNKTDKYLDQKEFWLHSMMTGNAAKRMAEDLGFSKTGEAFVGGLLHDLGIPVIHKYFHTNFIEIVKKVQQDNMAFLSAEVEELGYNHMEIGKFLTEKWNLPSILCEIVEFHETPSLAKEEKELVAIVHLADYATQKLKIGNFYWDENLQLDPVVTDILNFESIEKVEEFIDKYRNLFEEEIKSTNIL